MNKVNFPSHKHIGIGPEPFICADTVIVCRCCSVKENDSNDLWKKSGSKRLQR